MRINQYLSTYTQCSRREADRMITERRVYINQSPAKLGDIVSEQDEVFLDGAKIITEHKQVILAYHKPVGITSTTDQAISGNIIDEINFTERIFTIGRLDKDSSGLILLTNDGTIVNPLLRSENEHQKEYVVTLNHPVTPQFLHQMRQGVEIYNPVAHKRMTVRVYSIEKIGSHQVKLILTQGFNRQIRRMASACGFVVTKLKRIRFITIGLDNLEVGKWRILTDDEINTLLNHSKNENQ